MKTLITIINNTKQFVLINLYNLFIYWDIPAQHRYRHNRLKKPNSSIYLKKGKLVKQ